MTYTFVCQIAKKPVFTGVDVTYMGVRQKACFFVLARGLKTEKEGSVFALHRDGLRGVHAPSVSPVCPKPTITEATTTPYCPLPMVAILRWGKPHTPKGDFGEIGSESDSLAERKNTTMNPQRVRVVYNCAVSFLSEPMSEANLSIVSRRRTSIKGVWQRSMTS